MGWACSAAFLLSSLRQGQRSLLFKNEQSLPALKNFSLMHLLGGFISARYFEDFVFVCCGDFFLDLGGAKRAEFVFFFVSALNCLKCLFGAV